jgi:SAM-dependent methyltransferase
MEALSRGAGGRGVERGAVVSVLRLALLAVMEREALLHPRGASATARGRYAARRSILAGVRSAGALAAVFRGLHAGDAAFGLRPMGSWIFSPEAVRGFTQKNDEAWGAAQEMTLAWLRGLNETPPDAFAFGEGYEAMMARGARRAGGSFYTPRALVEHVLCVTLDERLAEGGRLPTVLDPACGSGNFLLAAAERLAARTTRSKAAALVHGFDIDPIAADLAAFALWRFVGTPGASWAPHRCRIRVQDAFEAAPGRKFGVVVGNPPFLNQLESATAHSRARAKSLSAWSGGAVAGYADTSAAFLLLGVRLAAPGGRVAMVQPQSLLAARDAGAVREALMSKASLTSLWLAGRSVFAGASVITCVPSFAVGGTQESVTLHDATTFAAIGTGASPEGSSAWSWHAARLRGVPTVSGICARGTLADLCRATADFRDQYYGLRGLVVEDDAVPAARRDRFPRLVTSGLIDLARCRWGQMPTRILKKTWAAPRVDLDRLERETDLGAWAKARLVPKILLATQTPVLEAVADPEGVMLPVTPVITITPNEAEDLWRVAAVLASPVATVAGYERTTGSALSPRALKLAASQVLALPVPSDRGVWDEAAGMLRTAHEARGDEACVPLILSVARWMNAAFGVRDDACLLAWWAGLQGLRSCAKRSPSDRPDGL